MQILQMIAERAGTAQYDTDLILIQDLWSQRNRATEDMRATDRIAIRRAAVALDRVGAVLSTRLSEDGMAAYRALPVIKPTTRVRKMPRSLWLEFSLQKPQGNWKEQSVMFVEFNKTGVVFGVRLPGKAKVLGKKTIRAVKRHNRACGDEAEMWRFERKGSPAAQNDCSPDINAWLAGRRADPQQGGGNLTLSKKCASERPSVKALEDGLSQGLSLFGNLLAPNRMPG